MKLFVDDFRECPPNWQPARTVTEAIRIIASQYHRLEAISLDHDITCVSKRGKHPSRETFEAVAHYIAAMEKLAQDGSTPHILIHTGNIQAGVNMARIMGVSYDNYIYRPEDYE